MGNFVLSIPRKNYRKLRLNCTYNDGVTPLDLTNLTVIFTAKDLSDSIQGDSAAVISITILTHLTPLQGITELEFNISDTDIPEGEYKCDLLFYSDIDLDPVNSQQGKLFITKKVGYGTN